MPIEPLDNFQDGGIPDEEGVDDFPDKDLLQRKCRICGEPRFFGDDVKGPPFDSPLTYHILLLRPSIPIYL
jgi:hypothetical protein